MDEFWLFSVKADQGVLPLAGSHNVLNIAAHDTSDFSRSATAYIQ